MFKGVDSKTWLGYLWYPDGLIKEREHPSSKGDPAGFSHCPIRFCAAVTSLLMQLTSKLA